MKLHCWSFLKELIPLIIILVVLNYFVFNNKFLALNPSPLWLLILLIAPRHGIISGFISGLSASVIYLWLMSNQGYLWQDMLHRQPELMVMPGLFLLFGSYLGILSEGQIKRTEYFKDKSSNLQAELKSSEIECAQLERDRIEMEKRFAGQGATLLTLHENFKKMGESASKEELFDNLDRILRDESKSERCGIWKINHDGIQLIAGGFNGDIPAIALAVGENNRAISAADWSLHNYDPPGADLAALILDNGSERLVAALGGSSFVHLTRVLALRVGLLAEQAGLVLKSMAGRQKLLLQAAWDPETGLVSETYLRRRVKEEIALAKRHKTSLSLLACSISGRDKNIQQKLDTVLSSSIRTCIRFSDGLAFFPSEQAFVMVLPQCDEHGAIIVLKKIEANLEQLNLIDMSNNKIYQIAWNIYTYDSTSSGDDAFIKLLSDIRIRANT